MSRALDDLVELLHNWRRQMHARTCRCDLCKKTDQVLIHFGVDLDPHDPACRCKKCDRSNLKVKL